MIAPRQHALLRAAEQAGRAGISTSDVPGVSIHAAGTAAGILVQQGRLWRGTIGHRTLRYFVRPEWATEYEATKRKTATVHTPLTRITWHPDAVTIIPAHVKVQRGPSPELGLRTNTHVD